MRIPTDDFNRLRALVQMILSDSSASWSLQGFGMLRLHLPGDFRLHVWDSRFAVPNVSTIHDHLQWGLESIIISGKLTNQRFDVQHEKRVGVNQPYNMVTLKPGYGTYHKTDAEVVYLAPQKPEVYGPGDVYVQHPNEVHESRPEDGTITLMRKLPTGDDSARVFWPLGEEWVSAEPRKALPEEVRVIVGRAILKWGDEENAR